MNVYSEWVNLNNEIDRQLTERLSKTKSTFSEGEESVNIHQLNDHNTLLEYWRISKELTIFINNNFADKAKEHFSESFQHSEVA